MIRRAARERREFIYRKTIEQRQKAIEDKRERLKHALEENRLIPTDLRKDALDIQKNIDWKDQGADGILSHYDDEYKWAGVSDPKIIITTSHTPSSRLKQFAKELKLIFPNSQRINRGNYQTKQLIEACRANECTDLIIVHETRGQPDSLQICHLPYGPTAYFTLYNVIMRHDIENVGTMSEAYPHLIFNNLTSQLGKRCMDILKYLFPVPKEDSKRVITFSNNQDYISFRHHTWKKSAENKNEIDLNEVGPRFEMKLYEIKLGTIDNVDTADSEWKLKPYMNTAKKREFLAK
ncbi:unnamed protein product [Brachionus calyciflorus]|uniref:Brix domain-containing protein n=1 Tax=Brachionus calyciflorus TaxID=104777 RepID=A0A813NPJ1_9BILA|nr:unnamed protein product [Brachionus calyciflorus]